MEKTVHPKSRTIDIPISNKNNWLLSFGSKSGIDLGNCQIHIKIYFNEELHYSTFLREVVISEPQRTVFQVKIPKNIYMARVFLTTNGDEDLSEIEYAFPEK